VVAKPQAIQSTIESRVRRQIPHSNRAVDCGDSALDKLTMFAYEAASNFHVGDVFEGVEPGARDSDSRIGWGTDVEK